MVEANHESKNLVGQSGGTRYHLNSDSCGADMSLNKANETSPSRFAWFYDFIELIIRILLHVNNDHVSF